MKFLLILVAIILLVVVLLVIIGCLLPAKHQASKEFVVKANAADVWQRLKDFKHYPEWRKKVKSVEVKSDTSWVEIDGRDNRLPLMVIAEEPVRKLVTKIDGNGLPFGGTWAFALQGNKNETMVKITENGEVYNPIFRFV